MSGKLIVDLLKNLAMNPWVLLATVAIYFGMLILIAQLTGRNAGNLSFFLGNRKSPWYIVAFGMIGASLSGVTFISAPGWVGSSQFSYMQMVLGYLLGYVVIIHVLLPLYYRLQLTSIYTYLHERLGRTSYKTGASFFLLSRIIGASFRLYLVAITFQLVLPESWNVPFALLVLITILLIFLYTFRGGNKTIIWTDTLQTIFMLGAVALSVYFISAETGFGFQSTLRLIQGSEYSRIFFFDDPLAGTYFFKQFFAGMFITIVMTGLDQDMMQKNLSCRTLKDAQKNMYWFSLALLPVNLLFLGLGALLYLYADQVSLELPAKADHLFPLIATGGFFPDYLAIIFLLGLLAAAYSSADSALTSLTTSFSVDILEIDRYQNEAKQTRVRKWVHAGISVALFVVILIFHAIQDESVIAAIFTVAGYTYGPLLGLYAYGLFTKLPTNDRLVPVIAILSPVLSWFIKLFLQTTYSYEMSFELLILNGFITYIGLWLVRFLPSKN